MMGLGGRSTDDTWINFPTSYNIHILFKHLSKSLLCFSELLYSFFRIASSFENVYGVYKFLAKLRNILQLQSTTQFCRILQTSSLFISDFPGWILGYSGWIIFN